MEYEDGEDKPRTQVLYFYFQQAFIYYCFVLTARRYKACYSLWGRIIYTAHFSKSLPSGFSGARCEELGFAICFTLTECLVLFAEKKTNILFLFFSPISLFCLSFKIKVQSVLQFCNHLKVCCKPISPGISEPREGHMIFCFFFL